MHILEQLVNDQKSGIPKGICSVCSSSPFVIEAGVMQAKETDTCLLLEATANQVNQFGGYTGMKPADFREFAYGFADKHGLPRDRIILGGDHLGPVAWQKRPYDQAIPKARALVYEFAKAGYTKIHLDASMPLADDDLLTTEEIAARTVMLCREAERGFAEWQEEHPDAEHPVYVIGSEVPTPGGAGDGEGLHVTEAGDLLHMLDIFKRAFTEAGLQESWDKVIAAVVQPGVEFGNRDIHEYVPEEAAALMYTARSLSGIVLEGHSTDYQPESALKRLVEDGVAILKVGPALTFAAREGLFQLAEQEKAMNPEDSSDFIEVLDRVMLENPGNWQGHYTTEEPESTYLRKYSLSDRSRYYMTHPDVEAAIAKLFANVKKEVPDPEGAVLAHVRKVLDQYWRAAGQSRNTKINNYERRFKMFGIDEKLLEERNGLFTAEEIAQQPIVWQKTYAQISELSDALSDFISDITGEPSYDIILTGAGTSEYVGNSLLPALLQKLDGHVHSIGTTEIVAAPRLYLSASRPTLLVSFARSGNSPESVGAVRAADAVCSKVRHLFITCNKDGALAEEARGRDDCFSIELTPETHDRGFAMTSSFSSMYLAALLALVPDAVSSDRLQSLFRGTASFIESSYAPVADFVRANDFRRVVYLGTGPLKGIAQEAALKILELTAGKMVALNNSPMGFRHGPKSVVDDDTVCIVFLSDEDDIRRYEMDLLKEIYRDKGGGKVLAVANRKDEEINANSDLAYFFDLGCDCSEAGLALPFVSVAQTIALLYSLKCGITPDDPCPSGEVNRVVKGVEIYPVN